MQWKIDGHLDAIELLLSRLDFGMADDPAAIEIIDHAIDHIEMNY